VKPLLEYFFVFFVAAILIFPAIAKEVPYLSGPVIDEVNLLAPAEKSELEKFIRTYKDIIQLQVWITPSLEGNDIESVSYKAAKEWKLGDAKKDNGALLLIVPQERRMRLEIGKGLEGDIPDILAGRILDNVVRPEFRRGAYFAGIRGALEQAVTLASGGNNAVKLKKHLEEDSPTGSAAGFFIFKVFLLFFIIFMIFASARGRRNAAYFGAGFLGGGGWGGGSGGFGGGGGGGWSGGGGSFGGGGASGSW
jgi:uncharacterized protein